MNVHAIILDYDYDFLKHCESLIDSHLDRLDALAQRIDDPDAYGIFDSCEHFTGFGFAACQTFISAVVGKASKTDALSRGPRHKCGTTFAALANACANYWKHNAEWDRNHLTDQASATIKILETLGIDVWSSYPMANALFHLISPHPSKFDSLLPLLKEWAINYQSSI